MAKRARQFIGIKAIGIDHRIYKTGFVGVVARHNTREQYAEIGKTPESIDSALSGLNEVLYGPNDASGIEHGALMTLIDGGATPGRVRKNATVLVELVIGLPQGHAADGRAFWTACVEWAKAYFDGQLLSAIVHRDEANPHAHLLIVPVSGGRLNGRAMSSGMARVHEIHAAFAAAVGARFDLDYTPPAQRMTAENRRHAEAMARKAATSLMEALQRNSHLMSDPVVAQGLTEAMAGNHKPLADALSVRLPITDAAHGKTFADLMTAPQGSE